jgi:hypothetical protein
MSTKAQMASQHSLRVHHVGLLVQHIETYLENSFWSLRSPIVYDPIQKARLCLVGLATDDGHLVELIEPEGEQSRTYRAFANGQRQHHICFWVPDRAVADALFSAYRFLPVTDWEPAPLFEGRPVRFAYTRNRELLEFVADEPDRK